MKHSSEGQSILPKVVLSRALFFCVGTTPLRLVPSISLYYVHLLLNIGINRTFTQTAEVLRDLFKLVKSNSSDLPHGLPLHVNQKNTVLNLLRNDQEDSQGQKKTILAFLESRTKRVSQSASPSKFSRVIESK